VSWKREKKYFQLGLKKNQKLNLFRMFFGLFCEEKLFPNEDYAQCCGVLLGAKLASTQLTIRSQTETACLPVFLKHATKLM
jgi:hypothetical protein